MAFYLARVVDAEGDCHWEEMICGEWSEDVALNEAAQAADVRGCGPGPFTVQLFGPFDDDAPAATAPYRD